MNGASGGAGSGEYAAFSRLWESMGLVAACWCWHTVGFWDSRHTLVGCGVDSWMSLHGEAYDCCVVCGCVWGLLFENCIVDASILFFVAASLMPSVPPWGAW